MTYNIFNTIHRPLKTALLSGCIAISKSFEDPDKTELALANVKQVLEVAQTYSTFEKKHILPMVFDFEPGIWSNYNDEHAEAKNLEMMITGYSLEYQQLKRKEERQHCLVKLNEVYNDYVLLLYNLMSDKEAILNGILNNYYPESYLRKVAEKIDAGVNNLQPGIAVAA